MTKSFRASVYIAMILPFLGTLIYWVILPGSRPAQLVYFAVKIFMLVWPLVCLRLDDDRFEKMRVVRDANHSLMMGIVSGLALAAIFFGAYRFGLGGLLSGYAPMIRAKVAAVGILPYYIPFAVFICVAHSFLEEYYWRWFVFGRLRRVIPLPWAMGLAGFAFALHHYVILWQFVGPELALFFGTGVGLGGIFWAGLYARTRSLLGPWISHALADAAILTIGYRIISGGA